MRNFKSFRPEIFALGNSRFSTAAEPSSKQNPPVRSNIANVFFCFEGKRFLLMISQENRFDFCAACNLGRIKFRLL